MKPAYSRKKHIKKAMMSGSILMILGSGFIFFNLQGAADLIFQGDVFMATVLAAILAIGGFIELILAQILFKSRDRV